MGAQYLYRFPHLEILHIHQAAPPGPVVYERTPSPDRLALVALAKLFPKDQGPGAGPDDAVKDLIIPWRKHCPRLREIQFVQGYVWRRAFDGDEWCKRRTAPPDRYRELS